MPVEFEQNTDLDEIMTDTGWVGRIVYSAEYAMYVEFETAYAGSQPPFQPIFDWVKRNWGDISSAVKEVAEEDGQTVEEHQERVAWVIVESIAESGTTGIHFGKRSLEQGQQEARTIAEKHRGKENAPKLIAQDLVDLMFEYSQDIIANEASDSGNLLKSGSTELSEETPE